MNFNSFSWQVNEFTATTNADTCGIFCYFPIRNLIIGSSINTYPPSHFSFSFSSSLFSCPFFFVSFKLIDQQIRIFSRNKHYFSCLFNFSLFPTSQYISMKTVLFYFSSFFFSKISVIDFTCLFRFFITSN